MKLIVNVPEQQKINFKMNEDKKSLFNYVYRPKLNPNDKMDKILVLKDKFIETKIKKAFKPTKNNDSDELVIKFHHFLRQNIGINDVVKVKIYSKYKKFIFENPPYSNLKEIHNYFENQFNMLNVPLIIGKNSCAQLLKNVLNVVEESNKKYKAFLLIEIFKFLQEIDFYLVFQGNPTFIQTVLAKYNELSKDKLVSEEFYKFREYFTPR